MVHRKFTLEQNQFLATKHTFQITVYNSVIKGICFEWNYYIYFIIRAGLEKSKNRFWEIISI